MNNSASAARRTWNRVMNALVWASAVLVIVLVAGILGMVLVRGIPHISWKFLTTTASVLKGTDGILPALLNTLYVILLTLLIVLPLCVGAAVYLTEYAQNRKVISVIEFTNETLAGIPSIIYGLGCPAWPCWSRRRRGRRGSACPCCQCLRGQHSSRAGC